MAIELKMPALSPTMEEGTLAKWLVKEGDEVKSGDILAEIETDKATMEFEAVDEGVVGKILIAAGTDSSACRSGPGAGGATASSANSEQACGCRKGSCETGHGVARWHRNGEDHCA
jgi:pyruvate dehydrogenase E1 component beta subunit